MARDNSPRDRQQRKAQLKLFRKCGGRIPRARVLIVCEGSETEVNYFKELCRFHRLSSAHVSVMPGAKGTCPLQVVEYARKVFVEGKAQCGIAPRSFDEVYVVFDRDVHAHYHAALQKAASLHRAHKNTDGDAVDFVAIPSVPCFELWLLLHFTNVTASISHTEIQRRLCDVFPGYHKSRKDLYSITHHALPQASQRAHRLNECTSPQQGTDPCTHAVLLVERLAGLNK